MNYYSRIKSLLIEATSGKTLRAIKTKRGSIEGKPLTFKTKKGYTPPSRNPNDQVMTHVKTSLSRYKRKLGDAL